MSDTNNTYSIVTLNPKHVPAAGNRLAVVRFRNPEGKAVKQARMCELPKIDVAYLFIEPSEDTPEWNNEVKDALSVLTEAIEQQQDNVLRSRIDAGIFSVSDIELQVPQMLAQLNAESVSKRLTKDQIEEWVRGPLSSFIAERAIETMPEGATTPVLEEAHLATVLSAYVDNMSKLAATVPALNQAKAEALKKMIERSQLADHIAQACLRKLTIMLAPQLSDTGAL